MPDFHGFGQINSIPNKRTTLDTLSYEKKMTLSEGDLRPCYLEEVLPSDIFHLKDSFVIKNLPSPYRPVIDDSYLDISYFFVPRRLLWKHWEEFIGADATPDAYTSPTVYEEPTIELNNASSSGGSRIYAGSVLNDFGLPVMPYGSTSTGKISPFPIAAFAMIWNEFYRDENLQDENPVPGIVYNLANGSNTVYPTGDLTFKWAQVDQQATTAGLYSDLKGFNQVNKYHDLFTNCLPKPQKGDPVTLPLGVSAPVSATLPGQAMIYNAGSASMVAGSSINLRYNVDSGETAPASITAGSQNGAIQITSDTFTNMGAYADLSKATAADINSLRLAFAAQAYLEALARGGSRYTELLTQMFGVSPSDARMQRPEFLGTIHYRITQTAVASTNGQRSNGSPQDGPTRATGSLGAYSVGGDSKNVFVKQFPEHGYVIGVASIRVQHTYGQGIPKIFLKKDRFDYFNKYFDRMGNVPVQTLEMHYLGSGAFGFAEAWYENKFHWNEVSGPIGPGGTADLKSWTYADDYGNTAPSLDGQWILEERSRLDQTLISSGSVPQFVLDIYHQVKATRPFSVNSVPAGIGF